MSILRIFQWLGVAVVLFVFVGLTYDFDSEAGKTVNAPVEDALSQGLLGYWKMDEGTGTSTTADSSGNANNLTMTAMESGDWVAGNIGAYSLDFDGSAEWLTVSDPASGILDFTDGRDFSISGWFNRDTFTTDDTVVAKRNGIANTDDGYIVYLDDATDQLIFEVSEAGGTDEYQVASTSTFTATGWNHFVAVWDDGNAAQTELYINGKADNGTDTGTIANIGDLSNAVAFDIGAESDNGNPFDGKIDDVKLYGKALSAAEVSRLYQTTVPGNPVDTGLVGHWTFDGPDVNWGDTSNEIKDVSGKGNHGDAAGSLSTTSVTSGKLGQGLSFNGTSDYVNIGNTSQSAYSVSLWINPSSTITNASSARYLMKLNNDGSDDVGTICLGSCTGFTTDETITLKGSNGSEGSFIYTSISTGWHHLVFVYSSSKYNIFLDGSDQVSDTYGSPGVETANQVTIGHASLTPFSGKIDDVRVYNRTLTASEIASLYNMSR